MIKRKSLFFVLLSLPLLQFCSPTNSSTVSNEHCDYTLAYTNFSGNNVELLYGEEMLYSGYISIGDESTGLNFTQNISIEKDGVMVVVVDGQKHSIEVENYCSHSVVYVQSYEPFLRLTDDKEPIVY